METIELFQVEISYINFISIILLIICIFLICNIIVTLKKKSKFETIMELLVLIVFFTTMIYTSAEQYLASRELFNTLNSNNCFVAEGMVDNFHTSTVFGHESEAFTINGIKFEYSNSIEPGYSKTKQFGGCIKGNGQLLKISYITIDEKNIILRIEEIKHIEKNN